MHTISPLTTDYAEALAWFTERIGQKVYRKPTSEDCSGCNADGYVTVTIDDEAKAGRCAKAVTEKGYLYADLILAIKPY